MERVSPDPQAGRGLLVINGKELPIMGPVSVQDLARWASKITNGDYSYDSDQTTSTWVMSSLTGGIGNEKLKEGVDDETYWTGNLETRYPGMLTLGAYTHEMPSPAGGASAAYPISDYPARSPSLYAAFDTTLSRWDDINRTFVVAGTLAGVPANKGVDYDNRLWIPLGENGYAIWDGTTLTNITTGTEHLDVVAFCIWDNKLAALTTDGFIRLRFGATTWEAALPALQLPSGAVPRNLVVFVNQQQEPTIHVITNTDVWAFDRENNHLYRTQLQFPAHPDHGRASTNWRGESLYISVGLGIHSYNGGIVASMGPDGRYGLPSHLRGVITDLEPEYNALIAVVQGQQASSDYEQQYRVTGSQYEQNEQPFRGTNARSCVLRWTQSGWHPVWEAPTAEGLPTWAYVSRADNKYRLWWGYADAMHYQELPYTFHNPKAGMEVGVNEFAPTGSLTTGWFDADMVSHYKTALHAEVLTEDVFGTGQPTGTVSVYYQLNDDPGWVHLGTTSQVGRAVFPFGVRPNEYGHDFSYGQGFRRIRFRFDMAAPMVPDFDNPDENAPYVPARHLSPVMNAFLLKFYKVPLSQLSFTFTVDLQQSEGFMGMGTKERSRFLRQLASGNEVAVLVHRDEEYRVRITQTMGNETTGYDLRAGMQVSALELPLPESDLREVSGE